MLKEFMDLCLFNRYENHIGLCQNKKLNENTYTEKHHIIPKSFGGSNSKDNLIVLSVEDHIIAHYLLWKDSYDLYKEEKMSFKLYQSSLYTINFMLNISIKILLNMDNTIIRELIKKQSFIREEWITSFSGQNNPFYGKKHTNESKKLIRESAVGRIYTEESKFKMGASFRGKTFSEEHKRKISCANTGRKLSKEAREKISKNQKSRTGKKNSNFKGYYHTPWGKSASIGEIKKYLIQNNIVISKNTVYRWCKDLCIEGEYSRKFLYGDIKNKYFKKDFWFEEKTK